MTYSNIDLELFYMDFQNNDFLMKQWNNLRFNFYYIMCIAYLAINYSIIPKIGFETDGAYVTTSLGNRPVAMVHWLKHSW